MNGPDDALLSQLLDLIDRLRDETAGFLDEPGDQQLWYNRGYANGMVKALIALGLESALLERAPDERQTLDAHVSMPWGQAYRHGEAKGRDETFEITGTTPT